MSNPESIRVLLNQTPLRRAAKYRTRKPENPKTADFIEVYRNLASAHLLKGDFDGVIGVCQEIESVQAGMPDVHFYWARALFNLALRAADVGNSQKAINLLTEATCEVGKDVSVMGVSWEIVALLTQVFGLKVKILSPSILAAGLDSSESLVLREALDCQIVCSEKLNEIKPSHQTFQMLKDLQEVRLRLQPTIGSA